MNASTIALNAAALSKYAECSAAGTLRQVPFGVA